MKEKLAVTIFGNPDSGKSFTWNELFDSTVRTGTHIRRLYFNEIEYVEVFLVSGSPEERHLYVKDIIGNSSPTIVLCSMQYRVDATTTIDFFLQEGFTLYTQWINPGFSDQALLPDSLGLTSYLLYRGSTISLRDGKISADSRVREIKEFIYIWAKTRNLLKSN